jgi:hypothetical protein
MNYAKNGFSAKEVGVAQQPSTAVISPHVDSLSESVYVFPAPV